MKNLTFYQKIVCYVIFFVVGVQWLIADAYLPQILGWVPEGIIVATAGMVVLTEENGFSFILWRAFFFFTVVMIISFFINGTSILMLIVFCRMILRYYLLGCIVYSIYMTEEQELFFVNLLFKVFLLQIIVAPIKFAFWEFGEKPMSMIGHSTTTFTTLIGVGLAISYGFLEKKWKKATLLLLGFMLVAIAGGKRGTAFYIPVVIIAAALKFRSKKVGKKGIGAIIAIFCIVPFIVYIVCRMLPTLNPQRVVGGSFDYKYVFDYAMKYSLGVSPTTGMPVGRMSAIIFSLDRILESTKHFLFGFGPGIAIKSTISNVTPEDVIAMTGVEYGTTGFVWLILQVGTLGAFLFYRLMTRVGKYAKYCLLNDDDANFKIFYGFMIMYSFIISFVAFMYDPAFKSIYTDSMFYIGAGLICRRYERIYAANELIEDGEEGSAKG